MADEVTESTEASPQPMQFSASIALNVLTPKEGVEAPTLFQVMLSPPKMPIQLCFETPDVQFVSDLAEKIREAAATLSYNKNNDKYRGQHGNIDPETFDADLRAAVEAAQAGSASNNTDGASSEKE